MLVLFFGGSAQAVESADPGREDHSFQHAQSLSQKKDSFVRMLRSKTAYYFKRTKEAVIRTIHEKPMAAMLSLMLVIIPPVFGFKVMPALLMAIGYFTVNIFVELGSLGYLIALGCGFMLIVNNIFE